MRIFQRIGIEIRTDRPSRLYGIGGGIMTTMQIGKELVALCEQGKNQEAIDRCYSPNVESVEPVAMPGMEQTQRGIANIKGKNQWWVDNHEVHGIVAEGPFPHGDRFIVRLDRKSTRLNSSHITISYAV